MANKTIIEVGLTAEFQTEIGTFCQVIIRFFGKGDKSEVIRRAVSFVRRISFLQRYSGHLHGVRFCDFVGRHVTAAPTHKVTGEGYRVDGLIYLQQQHCVTPSDRPLLRL